MDKHNTRDLRAVIFSNLKDGNYCVILDHLERVTPQINMFLSALSERACVITASRQGWKVGDYSFTGRLEYGLYLVPKLEIRPLGKRDAVALMQRLYQDLALKLPDKQGLFDEIFHRTCGNPGLMREIFDRARRRNYETDGRLNLKLIQIDCRIELAETL